MCLGIGFAIEFVLGRSAGPGAELVNDRLRDDIELHTRLYGESAGEVIRLLGKRTKETARMVVAAVVEEVKKKLEQRLRQAVLGALNRKEQSPLSSATAIDWKWIIGRNL